ncbi:PH domain-containing protein [Archaeoglobus sp.]
MNYLDYADYNPNVVFTIRPSVFGFMRRYLLCLTPIVALAAYRFIDKFLYALLTPLKLLGLGFVVGIFNLSFVLFILLALAWVFRSSEVEGAVGLSLTIPLILALIKINMGSLGNLIEVYLNNVPTAIFIAVALMLIRTEIYRRTISYKLTDVGVEISGGIWRRQEQAIPYNQIGRVVLEQSIFGRILNYGTVIPVSSAEWGSEYYTRALGVAGKVAGAGYMRTLKEVSRDPLKCLYGVKNPKKIKEIIEKMMTATFRAEIDQVEYLKKIYEEISRK